MLFNIHCYYILIHLYFTFLNPAAPHTIESCQETGNAALNLTTDWQDIILVPAVLDLFFTLYWKVRGHPQLAYHARTCLVRLASLKGITIARKEVELQYLSNYMERFLKFITSVDIIDQEAVGIANIIRTLLIFFKTNSLPENTFKSFLEQLSRLTCSFLENAAQEELVSNILNLHIP